MDVVKPAGNWASSISEDRRNYAPQAGFDEKLQQWIDEVNVAHVSAGKASEIFHASPLREAASSYESNDHESPSIRERECLTGISRQFGGAIPQSTRSSGIQAATRDFSQNTGLAVKTYRLQGDNDVGRYAGFIHPEQPGIVWLNSETSHAPINSVLAPRGSVSDAKDRAASSLADQFAMDYPTIQKLTGDRL